jgi:DNA-entry nuclease
MKLLSAYRRLRHAALLAMLLLLCLPAVRDHDSLPALFEPLHSVWVSQAAAGTAAAREKRSAKKPVVDKTAESAVRKLTAPALDLKKIPPYSKNPYIPVNGNIPYFKPQECPDLSFEYYSPLDKLGRCGFACANVGIELMPTVPRSSIAAVRPTAWHLVKYDSVNGRYLYNRCHLLGYQLTGEASNERNLITGTRALNVEAMLQFENMVADYVKETRCHVMYRVTPYFDGNNLLASGVLMEGWSVEDHGESICFNVFCYNAQPGIDIDYATGESRLSSASPEQKKTAEQDEKTETFILNTRTGVFHKSTCVRAGHISPSRRRKVTAARRKILLRGYKPCKICNP